MIDHDLKEILADKRIRGWGVPEDEWQNYLMAETFVIDFRNVSLEETIQTYNGLVDMGLNNPPYERFVLHVIATFTKDEDDNTVAPHDGIISFYRFTIDNVPKWGWICDDEEKLRDRMKKCNEIKDVKNHFTNICNTAKMVLYVMLATRNVVKEYHNPPKAQRGNTSAARKRGSGGYTIVRPPRADEMPNYVAGGVHASPRPHLRRGHVRHFEDGSTTWVSPCFVNGEPIEARKAYIVRK